MGPEDAVELGDGLVVRRARDADLEAIVALSVEAHGAQEEWGVRFVTDREGIDAWTVVCDGDAVVSTCALMAQALEVSGGPSATVRVPAAQIEYVATAPSHRGRGLVRAQFRLHEAQAAERGDLVVLVAGIPYFYRALGYRYAIAYPDRFRVTRVEAPPGSWRVDPAEGEDLPAIRELHARSHERAGLRMPRPDADWEAIVAPSAASEVRPWVARSAGGVRGWMRATPYEEDGVFEVLQAASDGPEAAAALLHHALGLAGELPLGVLGRPGDPFDDLLRAVGEPAKSYEPVYARCVDRRGLLERLRPVLEARLAASPLRGHSGELPITLYEEGITLELADGHITAVRAAPAVHEPFGTPVAALPPDAFEPLVLGRFDASELARRFDDCALGAHGDLLAVLFPRLDADVVGVL